MNWRGILGIYAGLAIVLAGGWFWVQSSALWALGVVAAGLAVAALSVAQIIIKRRGPRTPAEGKAKAIRMPRAARNKVESSADFEEANSVAKARMALIAGRAAGRLATVEWNAATPEIESVEGVDVVDAVVSPVFLAVTEEVAPFETVAVDAADEPATMDHPISGGEDADGYGQADTVVSSAAGDLTGMRAWSATLSAVLLPGPTGQAPSAIDQVCDADTGPDVSENVADEPSEGSAGHGEDDGAPAVVVESEAIAEAEAEIRHDCALAPPFEEAASEPIVAADSATLRDAEVALETGPEVHETETEALVTEELGDLGPMALDKLPGFPWTARFIGIWAREVRFACPDDLRGAVIHWQRWADGQPTEMPVIEEAAAEFNAMLDVWRECGAEVPGLSSDDWTASQLAGEAAEDLALAALLPPVLRSASLVVY